MNELKMLFSISAVIALNGVGTERALAHEPGDFGQYTRGITIGDPLGATPPPGLYFENIALYVPGASGQGQLGAFKANGLLDAPTFLWSTGYSFLGANLAVLLSQPFYQAEMWGGSAAGPPYGGVTLYPTVHNTWVSPFPLSWNLGSNLFCERRV